MRFSAVVSHCFSVTSLLFMGNFTPLQPSGRRAFTCLTFRLRPDARLMRKCYSNMQMFSYLIGNLEIFAYNLVLSLIIMLQYCDAWKKSCEEWTLQNYRTPGKSRLSKWKLLRKLQCAIQIDVSRLEEIYETPHFVGDNNLIQSNCFIRNYAWMYVVICARYNLIFEMIHFPVSMECEENQRSVHGIAYAHMI